MRGWKGLREERKRSLSFGVFVRERSIVFWSVCKRERKRRKEGILVFWIVCKREREKEEV